MSRVAILGGGVAGLASAHRLLEAGFDVRVLERKRLPRGIGFLLLDNGRAAARRLGVWGALLAAAHPINGFELRAPGSCPAVPGARDAAGNVRQQIPLDVHSFVYADFVSRLAEGLPDGTVRRGPAVVGLDREADGRVVAARLDDGDRIEADLFVASDGVRSIARAALFPEARLRPCQVHELVNIVDAPGVAERLGRAFVKYEDPKAGVALGLVPCSEGRVVWFLQVDAARHPTEGADAEAFACARVRGWDALGDELLARTDFTRAYWWRTGDMKPLSSLAVRNVALLGDAAHPFLPFTSQGVAHALCDAVTLGDCLVADPADLERALARYSAQRLPMVTDTFRQGHRIRDRFLDPSRADVGAVLPLALVPQPDPSLT